MKQHRRPAAHLYDLELYRHFNAWMDSMNAGMPESLLDNADALAQTLGAYLDAFASGNVEKVQALSEDSLGMHVNQQPLRLSDEQYRAIDGALSVIGARSWNPGRYPSKTVPKKRRRIWDDNQEFAMSCGRDFKSVTRLFLSMEPSEIVYRSSCYCFLREVRNDLYRRLQDKLIPAETLTALCELSRPFDAVFSIAFLEGETISDYLCTDLEEPLQAFLRPCSSLEKWHEQMLLSQTESWRNEFALQKRIRQSYLKHQKHHLEMPQGLLVRDCLTVAAIRNCYAKLAAINGMPIAYVDIFLCLEDPLQEIAAVYEEHLVNDEPIHVWKAIYAVKYRHQAKLADEERKTASQ